MRKPSLLVFIALAAVVATRAQAADAKISTPNRSVVVSILPQAYFVERIGGGAFKATVLVGPGQSPHSYEPTPRQMAELAKAAAWMSVGVDFEKALKPKVAKLYPSLRIVDTTALIEYRRLDRHHHEGGAVRAEDAHGEEEGGLDPHVWLGRQASKAMASSMRDALSDLDPVGTAVYAKNCDSLIRDIDATFDGLAKDLLPLRGKPVFVYHPSFGYFLDEFGIEQEAVELGGKEPTQKALAKLIDEARTDGATVIFVQAQFPSDAARTVAKAIGGVVETIDPLAPDWLANLRRIGAALKKAAR